MNRIPKLLAVVATGLLISAGDVAAQCDPNDRACAARERQAERAKQAELQAELQAQQAQQDQQQQQQATGQEAGGVRAMQPDEDDDG